MVMVDSCRAGSDLIVTSRQRNSTPDTVVEVKSRDVVYDVVV